MTKAEYMREYQRRNYEENHAKYRDIRVKYLRNRAKRFPGYYSWKNMLMRCYYESHKAYKYYGGKGIKVCDRWMGKDKMWGWDGFLNFIDDMGIKPGEKYSIDRINPNENYSPENCRWITISENIRRAQAGRQHGKNIVR